MIKIKQNKKAQIGESIQDLVGAIIIIILLVIFFVVSKSLWGNSTVEVKQLSEDLSKQNQETLSLQAWLQKPTTITYQNQETTIPISQLILLAQIDPLYKTLLEDEASKDFGADYKINIATNQNQGTQFYVPSNETITITIKKITIKK